MHHRWILPSVVPLVVVSALLVGCVSVPATPAVTTTVNVPTAATTATVPAVLPSPAPREAASAVPTDMATASPIAVTDTPQRAKVSIEEFTLNSQALKGNLLGDPAERPVQVILPPGYATSNKRYPVVYYLHGFGGGAAATPMLDIMNVWFKSWAAMHTANREVATGDFVAAIQAAMQPGAGQELILVFPNASNRLGGSLYLSSPTIGDYETYLSKELVDYVDSHYRTLPQRESRAVAGCSMGGDGTVHLALKFPGVYSVAAAQSGTYFWDREPGLVYEPTGQSAIAEAAAAAPNANRPPNYADETAVTINGKTQLAPAFIEKLKAADARADVKRYLAQPTRLRAFLVQQGKNDPLEPPDLGRDFDKLLTQSGIPHVFDDTYESHCTFDMVAPMLKFLSDHLVGEKSTQ